MRCGSGSPHDGGATSWDDLIRGPDHLRARQPRGLRAAPHRRHADLHRGQRGRRRRHGHHPRDPRRGPHQRDPEGVAGAGRAGDRGPPRVRPHAPDRERGSARSCRSDATTCRWGTTATAASCPRRWSTTWRCSGWGPPDGVEVRPIGEIISPVRRRRHQHLARDVRRQEARVDQRRLPPGAAGRGLHRPMPAVPRRRAVGRRRRRHGVRLRSRRRSQTRVKVLSEVPALVDFLFLDEPDIDDRTRGTRRSSPTRTPVSCSTARSRPTQAAAVGRRSRCTGSPPRWPRRSD